MFKKLPIILISLVILTGSVFAGVPYLINYRGNLVESGTPINGTRQINFQLYDVPTGGGPLWESGNQDIDIVNGAFAYTLGLDNSSTFSNINWKNKEIYLQVVIDNTIYLSPRERIGSVGYALVAQEAVFVKSSNVDLGSGNRLSDWETNSGMIKGSKVVGIVSDSGDSHSLDAVDGSIINVVYVNTNGNVGIGINNPNSKLHVNGNIIASNFKYIDIKTNYYAVTPSDFVDSETFQDQRYLGGGGTSLLNKNSLDNKSYYAPVHLPQGSTVIKFVIYYTRNDILAIGSCELYRSNWSGVREAMSDIGNWNLTGMVSQYDDIIANGLIDNSGYHYLLELQLDPNDDVMDIFFLRALIEFSVNSPGQ